MLLLQPQQQQHIRSTRTQDNKQYGDIHCVILLTATVCSLFFRAEQQHESYCFCLLVVVMVHINNRLLSFKCSLVFVNLQLQLSSATCDGEKEEEVMSTDRKWPCFCFNDKFYVAGDHRLFPFSFFIFNKFVLLCFAFF